MWGNSSMESLEHGELKYGITQAFSLLTFFTSRPAHLSSSHRCVASIPDRNHLSDYVQRIPQEGVCMIAPPHFTSSSHGPAFKPVCLLVRSTREYLFSQRVGRPQRRPTTKYAKLLQSISSVLLLTSRLQAILLVLSFQGIFIFTASRAPRVAPDYKIC